MFTIKIAKKNTFFVPSGSELSCVLDLPSIWNAEVFAVVYRMLNVLQTVFDIDRVHVFLLTY